MPKFPVDAPKSKVIKAFERVDFHLGIFYLSRLYVELIDLICEA